MPDTTPHLLTCDVALDGDATGTRKLRLAMRHLGGPPAEDIHLVVHFDSAVSVGLGFQTAPERALLGKLTGDSGGEVELRVARLAGTVTHAFLFHVRAPDDDIGSAEIAYRHPTEGERTLHVPLAAEREAMVEPGATAPDPAESGRSAAAALEAYRGGDRGRCAENLRILIRITEPAHIEEMLARLDAGATLTREMLDLLFRISHGDDESQPGQQSQPEPDTSVYDVVLVDAGEAPIAVMREIRAATALPLSDVNDILKKHVAIGHALPFAQAGALKRQVEAAGGTVELHHRDAPLEEPASDPESEPDGGDKKRKRRRRWR